MAVSTAGSIDETFHVASLITIPSDPASYSVIIVQLKLDVIWCVGFLGRGANVHFKAWYVLFV
jgi:hypothetical protein